MKELAAPGDPAELARIRAEESTMSANNPESNKADEPVNVVDIPGLTFEGKLVNYLGLSL